MMPFSTKVPPIRKSAPSFIDNDDVEGCIDAVNNVDDLFSDDGNDENDDDDYDVDADGNVDDSVADDGNIEKDDSNQDNDNDNYNNDRDIGDGHDTHHSQVPDTQAGQRSGTGCR